MTNEETVTRRKWSQRKKLLSGLAITIGISMCVIFPGLFWQLHEANRSFQNFADALVAKDYSRAYSFTTQEFHNATNYDSFVKANQDIANRMGDLQRVRFIQSDIKETRGGWLGTLDANLVFTKGVVQFSYVLKKEKNNWKIYGYQEQ